MSGAIMADWERELLAAPSTFAPAQVEYRAPGPFDEADPSTWGTVPDRYEWRECDPETGELHLYAPDGRDVTAALTTI